MESLLKLNNVNKHYPKFDLSNVSFSVEPGQIVGFIGRNGAGKTTTLKGIMNLLHFDSGEVFAFGKNIRESEIEAKQKIGFTLSEISYYPNKTIAQIVDVTKRFYNDFSEEKYSKLCTLFNLDVNKKIEQLSSGMKVKFSLAIALSYNAKLLILDEPTSGLDPVSRDEILTILENIVKDGERAVLFSTHITSDLDKCASNIVYIKNGSIIYNGTKEDFVNEYYEFKCDEKAITSQLLDKTVSFKKHGSSIEGLIHAKDKNAFSKDVEGIKIFTPDLEQIMINVERGHNNEEFTL